MSSSVTHTNRRCCIGPKLILALAATALPLHHALASIRTVTSLNDSGAGSLRDAIASSNPGDSITFDAGLAGTILLSSTLNINADLNISEPSPNSVIVSGGGGVPVFYISSGVISFSGLTVADGAGNYSAIGNQGSLTMMGCVVTNCAGRYPIINLFGFLVMSNCTVSGNTSASAAVWLGGPTIINNCTICDNTNTSADSGGGIYGAGTLAMTNCTLARNNVSTGNGAAVFTSQPLTINCCTVASNSCSAGAGGGIYVSGSSATTRIMNTIVSGNSASTGGQDVFMDTAGLITSMGFNLIGATNDSAGWIASDLVGSAGSPLNPLLGPLQNNGGVTLTMALLAGSPAIDQGKSFGANTDQRGQPRPFDQSSIANAPGGDGSDIGAFELNPPVLNFVISGTNAILSWPAYQTGYTLQATPSMPPSGWTNVPGVVTVGAQFVVTNGPILGNQFFRLKQ